MCINYNWRKENKKTLLLSNIFSKFCNSFSCNFYTYSFSPRRLIDFLLTFYISLNDMMMIYFLHMNYHKWYIYIIVKLINLCPFPFSLLWILEWKCIMGRIKGYWIYWYIFWCEFWSINRVSFDIFFLLTIFI